jgi:hypothetical protein
MVPKSAWIIWNDAFYFLKFAALKKRIIFVNKNKEQTQ